MKHFLYIHRTLSAQLTITAESLEDADHILSLIDLHGENWFDGEEQ